MCNASGLAPGAIAQVDLVAGSASLWSGTDVQSKGTFNPHGTAYSPEYGLIAADYISPASLFAPPPFLFRDTLHHFNPDGSFNGTIDLPTSNGGFMDFHYSTKPGYTHYGMTMSATGNTIFRVNALNHSDVVLLADLAGLVGALPAQSAGLFSFSKTGNRMIITFQLRAVMLIAFDDSFTSARVLQEFDFCKDVNPTKAPQVNWTKVCEQTDNYPGSHYIRFDADETRVVIANYFIRIAYGNFPGSGTIHSFNIRYINGEMSGLDYDYSFVNSLAISGTPGFPHGSGYIYEKPTLPNSSPVLGSSLICSLVFMLLAVFLN